MVNESGLKPAGRALLVAPYAPELKSGLIFIPDETLKRDQMVDQRAVIVEIGPSAWCDEPQPRAKVGDKVLIAKYSGFMATGTKDNKSYRFINDRDVFALIEVEL